MGVVEETGCFADADDDASFDAGVSFDRRVADNRRGHRQPPGQRG